MPLPDEANLVWAYRRDTGEKLPHRIPRSTLAHNTNLSETPLSRAPAPEPTPVAETAKPVETAKTTKTNQSGGKPPEKGAVTP
jgi:hypothetical protein